jgi:5'-3' exoribonuclease 2
MENNVSYKIVGIERIKIKKFDGMVRTLIEVIHVPKIKKNIISLGFLDSRGYKFTSQGRALKVSKGILVVMKETNFGNLYKMEGNTQINEAIVVFEEANEYTCL